MSHTHCFAWWDWELSGLLSDPNYFQPFSESRNTVASFLKEGRFQDAVTLGTVAIHLHRSTRVSLGIIRHSKETVVPWATFIVKYWLVLISNTWEEKSEFPDYSEQFIQVFHNITLLRVHLTALAQLNSYKKLIFHRSL